MKKHVFVLGNILDENDRLPVQLLPELIIKMPDIHFDHFDPTEEISIKDSNNIILIDTVMGINQVKIYTDFDDWARSPRVSVHDFDLPLQLGILKKLGKIKSVTVIGVPTDGDRREILLDIMRIVSAI